MKASVAVLASGSGSNFEALVHASRKRLKNPFEVALVVTDNSQAGAIERAKRLAVPYSTVPWQSSKDRARHENTVLKVLQKELDPDLLKVVVLAGYMRILSAGFLAQIKSNFPQARLINLHPAYLWVYKGARAYQSAIKRKANHWGLTVHEVTAELDSGPLISCKEFPVFPWETHVALHARLRAKEHEVLLESVDICLTNTT